MSTCYVCQKTKANLSCGVCQETICKSCAQFLAPEDLAYWTLRPAHLSTLTYCNPCYDKDVVPALDEYAKNLKAAKNISVFMKNQSKETRNFSRKELPVTVKECSDSEEALMRLAFQAVERDFNGIIDVEVIGEKIRNGGYQTQNYSGSGIPVKIEGRRGR